MADRAFERDRRGRPVVDEEERVETPKEPHGLAIAVDGHEALDRGTREVRDPDSPDP